MITEAAGVIDIKQEVTVADMHKHITGNQERDGLGSEEIIKKHLDDHIAVSQEVDVIKNEFLSSQFLLELLFDCSLKSHK